MRIGIDASRAFSENRTGIEEYSYQVIKYLRKYLKDENIFLYVRKNQKIDFDLPKNWKIKVIRWPRFWTQIGLSLEMLFHPVDALFVPAHTAPLIHPKKTIVAVHGLEYEFFPEGYSFWERLYMRLSIKFSCRIAKKIIAVSKNTKKDLVGLYKISEEKIKVVYEGTDTPVIASIAKQSRSLIQRTKLMCNSEIGAIMPEIASFASLPRNDIGMPYLLFIGRLEKRKNIEGIVLAFEILKEKHKIPHKLVLVGKSGYLYENIKFQISNSKWRKDILEVGYVSEEEKYNLSKNADVFLFPTFYEGFGLPILEAQNAGAPLVTSNVSSMPEVGGDAAAYADPNEPETIADAIWKILDDEEYRKNLVKKGYANSKKFSWEKCSEEISKLLKG